jgi:hypothetical protein
VSLPHLNWGAVMVAAAANLTVAAVWYAPRVFGGRWLTALNSYRRGGIPSGGAYALALVGAVATAVVLAVIAQWANVDSAVGGALLGFMVWLGFIVAANAGNFVFEGRPLTLIWINAGYHLLALVSMGAVIGSWH